MHRSTTAARPRASFARVRSARGSAMLVIRLLKSVIPTRATMLRIVPPKTRQKRDSFFVLLLRFDYLAMLGGPQDLDQSRRVVRQAIEVQRAVLLVPLRCHDRSPPRLPWCGPRPPGVRDEGDPYTHIGSGASREFEKNDPTGREAGSGRLGDGKTTFPQSNLGSSRSGPFAARLVGTAGRTEILTGQVAQNRSERPEPRGRTGR